MTNTDQESISMAEIDDTSTYDRCKYSSAAEWVSSRDYQKRAAEIVERELEKKRERNRQASRDSQRRKKNGETPKGKGRPMEAATVALLQSLNPASLTKEMQCREKNRQLARENYRRKKSGEPSRPRGRPKGYSRMLPVPVAASGARDGEATVHVKQSFDPVVNRKNPRWAMYRPYWLRESEKIVRIYPSTFRYHREVCLGMTAEQCAAFLRVDIADVTKWEAGIEPIPYAAFMALRLVHDVEFLPHHVKQWADWQIIEAGAHVGLLRDRISGEMFMPSDLRTWRYVRADAERLNRENITLKKQVAEMQAENTALRTLYLSNGVTKELHSMHARIAALLTNINTAEITELDFITKAT
jgi:hypothetical protein